MFKTLVIVTLFMNEFFIHLMIMATQIGIMKRNKDFMNSKWSTNHSNQPKCKISQREPSAKLY